MEEITIMKMKCLELNDYLMTKKESGEKLMCIIARQSPFFTGF